MENARRLGSCVKHLAECKGLSISDLSGILGCSELQTNLFLTGRSIASFPQISRLAKALDATVEDLLVGNQSYYNANVVHCMNEFDNESNREFILDLIYDYMDVVDAVTAQ